MEHLILVVDDMEPCREVICQILQMLGYSTLSAGNCADALKLVESEAMPETFVVLTDMNLPDLSGTELAAEIHVRKPQARIVFTSGVELEDLVESGRLHGCEDFIPKPFTLDGISALFRRVTTHPFVLQVSPHQAA